MPGAPSPGAPEQGVSRGLRMNRWKNLKDGEVLTAREMAQMWMDAGGSKRDAAMASAIANHESGRTVGRYNGSCCWGTMQVNAEAHGARYGQGGNEWDRVKKAVAIRRATRLTQGWGPNPWEVCHDRKCSNLASEARDIERQMKGLDVGPVNVPTPGDAIDSVGDAVADVVRPIGDFFKIIADADTWIRVGKVALGATLLIIVANQLTKGTAVAGAARRVPVAAAAKKVSKTL